MAIAPGHWLMALDFLINSVWKAQFAVGDLTLEKVVQVIARATASADEMVRLKAENGIDRAQRRFMPERRALPIETRERAMYHMLAVCFRTVRHQVEHSRPRVVEFERP